MTLPLKKKTTAPILKTITPCNRWKSFLSIPYPQFITFCLVWQHHVLQTSATVSKRFRIGPKSCILLQLFEAPCVRNSLIVKDLEHEKHRNALLQTLRRECTFAAAWKLRSSADTRKVHHLYFSALAVLNCCFNWHPVPSLQILFCFFRFRRAFFFFRWFFFFFGYVCVFTTF